MKRKVGVPRKEYEKRYRTGEKALSPDEYSRLLGVIDDLEDEVMIRLAVATGLRREDLVGIKISDISLDKRTLTFHEHKKDHTDKDTGVVTEKWRTIGLPDNIVALIRKFLKSLKGERREYLINYSGRTAYNRFQHYCELAKIDNLPRPLHALRATCIKFCHEAGWSDSSIAELTGDLIITIQQHYMTPSIAEMMELTKKTNFA